jgi:fused signal recognition particle receptor
MSWFAKLSDGLKKTSQAIDDALNKTVLNAQSLEALEESLLLADMGAATAMALTGEMAALKVRENIPMSEVRALLADAIAKRLAPYAVPLATDGASPRVVLVVGVNGNGKTTTIGKLAYQQTRAGKKVAMVAADTFRAAAVEQLQRWAERAGCAFHRGAEGADPASVAYAGLDAAMKAGVELVLIDTAGRLHTKKELMAELEKIIKVIRKLMPDAPHDVVQVLDATTGQNALSQLAAFKEIAGVTGLVVTKLDGTAKAGVVVALAEQFHLPIHAIGVGEGAEDLQPFTAPDFARALVGLGA